MKTTKLVPPGYLHHFVKFWFALHERTVDVSLMYGRYTTLCVVWSPKVNGGNNDQTHAI